MFRLSDRIVCAYNTANSSLDAIDVIIALIAVDEAVQLRMPSYDDAAPAELAVAGALVVHLGVVAVLQGVELVQLAAGVLAVADGVVPAVQAHLALALAQPLDVGGEVQPELHLGHLLHELGLLGEGST